MKWYLKYHRWVNIEEDTSLGITQYNVLDANGELIELNAG
jgi:ribonuclease G